jgi:metallo-beta-lactamase class B
VSIAAAGVAETDRDDSIAAHVGVAKAAAGEEHTVLFDTLCGDKPPSSAAVKNPPVVHDQPEASTRPPWHLEPAKVFDNLYFVGQVEYSAWAVTTSEGIIVVDALFDYSVEDEIVGGLKTLGLDPTKIKYVIVSHGHADHVGGARYLQETFGARVILSAADWDVVEADARMKSKPKRDIVAGDGYAVTLGDTTITLHLTPGHTPGTLSMLIPVKDGEQRHLAAEWGGTAFNFKATVDQPRSYWFDAYVGSAQRLRDIVLKAGADVLISNHSKFDGTVAKLQALATRRPGDPHPYVIGNDSVSRYLTVAAECARAGRLGMK